MRLASGFVDPASGANVFFWLMHSITLPLHGNLVQMCVSFLRLNEIAPDINAILKSLCMLPNNFEK